MNGSQREMKSFGPRFGKFDGFNGGNDDKPQNFGRFDDNSLILSFDLRCQQNGKHFPETKCSIFLRVGVLNVRAHSCKVVAFTGRCILLFID